ncbi:hypothetical protein Sjap_013196 [Stephania japonica]|uniref:Uncharacterized protein n=1 Tax=Stephania japonica TaxID=461633 RepID=A0AAP0NYY1_9MAGN
MYDVAFGCAQMNYFFKSLCHALMQTGSYARKYNTKIGLRKEIEFKLIFNAFSSFSHINEYSKLEIELNVNCRFEI